MKRIGWVAAVGGVVALVLAACSGNPGTGIGRQETPSEFVGWGTVIESAPGSGVGLLCLSGVAESAPPQCTSDGVPVNGLEWPAASDLVEVGGVRWFDGTFYGSWDGSAITLTRGFEVGDQSGFPAAYPDGDQSGDADDATIQRALDVFRERAATDSNYLTAIEGEGHVRFAVVYDDGTVQQTADEEFGPGVVSVYSILRAA